MYLNILTITPHIINGTPKQIKYIGNIKHSITTNNLYSIFMIFKILIINFFSNHLVHNLYPLEDFSTTNHHYHLNLDKMLLLYEHQ